jgi:hypothetical protein
MNDDVETVDAYPALLAEMLSDWELKSIHFRAFARLIEKVLSA